MSVVSDKDVWCTSSGPPLHSIQALAAPLVAWIVRLGGSPKPPGGGPNRDRPRMRTVPHQMPLSQLSIQFLSGVLALSLIRWRPRPDQGFRRGQVPAGASLPTRVGCGVHL